MQPSRAQKILKILSIISIVGAAINLVGAAILIFGGGAYAVNGAGAEGMSAEEIGTMAAAAGFATIITAIISFIEGFLGLRAAKDNTKIMPVWVLAVIALAGGIISLLMTLFGGNMTAESMGSVVGSLAASGLMFWLANTIKHEAGR